MLLYDGTRFWCGPTSDEEYAEIERRGDRQAEHLPPAAPAARHATPTRSGRAYPDIPRRVSGYNLDSLLPEHGFDVAGLLVGSESTLVTVLRAKLKLVDVLPERSLVVLGYPSIDRAADAVPRILRCERQPIALEGLDHRLITDEQIKHMNPQALQELPEGTAYLMVQFGGDSHDEVDQSAEEMLDALHDTEHEPDVSFYDDPAREDELWQVREAGLGATAHVPGHRDTFEGWEDSAVHPDRLGDYLRDLQKLYDEFGYSDETGPSLYGHFGQGCVHTRIPFDLYSTEGVAKYRRFMERAADLVVAHGGSLSGEHGDGQSRGELLGQDVRRRAGDRVRRAQARVRPGQQDEPGQGRPPGRASTSTCGSAATGRRPPRRTCSSSYPHDGGSFAQAANRCVGVGKCRHHDNNGGTVMCPSYQVTMEEEHSTRGRARLLFEMLDGHGDSPVSDGWRSDAVKDALDLCLACKGCKTDCPANVDMATYKAEFLAHHWQGRQWRRPRSDLALGWLPLSARAVSRAQARAASSTRPPTPRCCTGRRPGSAASKTAKCRCSPARPCSSGTPAAARAATASRGTVLLWPDTFTNYFHPHVGQAAVEVLESGGLARRAARRAAVLRADLDLHRPAGHRQEDTQEDRGRPAPHVRDGRLRGRPRAELHRRVPRRRARAVPRRPGRAAAARPHADPGRAAHRAHPRLPAAAVRRPVLAQVHCHQHAVMGWDADEKLLQAGRRARRAPGDRLLRPGRQLRLPGRATARSAEASAERALLPQAARGQPGRRGPGRRVQLPHPDPRAGQRRPGRHAPGRTARHRGQPRLRPPRAGRRSPARPARHREADGGRPRRRGGTGDGSRRSAAAPRLARRPFAP